MLRYAIPLIAVAIGLGSPPVRSTELSKITVREALSLAAALRNLDGHMVVTKQNGVEQTIMIPWEFSSGSLRLRIANDLAIAGAAETSLEKARQAIVKEIQKEHGGAEIKPGTPEYDLFLAQYSEALDQPAAGTQDLVKIKASELKLDHNEIAVTVLTALRPILEIDQ